ncbi:MAG: cellulase family glycosylhydrolase [Phycisphaerales bacterium]
MLRTLAAIAALAITASLHAAPPIAPKLAKGVNLSHWWWQSSDSTDKQITDADVKLIKSSGLTHVRIPIDPAHFIKDDKLDTDATNKFLKSVKLFTDAGLAVVIDCHPAGTLSKSMLPSGNSTGWEDELTKFWKTFAPALKSTPPELVAIELLNEPNGLDEAKAWPAAQERIHAAVRTILPRHTIVLTGDDWGAIDGLLRLTASKDANTVYSFHFYDSHTFTHQGATWGSPMWKEIKGLHYPFDAANTDAVIAATSDPKAINSIKAYAREKWDAAKIKARIGKAKAWADSQKPPATLYLGEFGAYKAGCDEASRKAWTTDVRTAAESANIGWCVWDYAGGFSISDKSGKGQRTINTDAANALGLVPNGAPKKKP